MQQKYPLTDFGTGIELSDFHNSDSLGIKEVNQLINDHQFIVFKKFKPSIEAIKDWVSNLGELVQNIRRQDENVLVLDGSKEEKEVIGGKGRMPLHCDGLLMNETIRLVCIYCVECRDLIGGSTYISNNEEVWNRIPKEIKTVILENGIEMLPCDKDYYLKNEEQWYPFQGYQERNGQQYLNAGLHYHPSERASWKIRFQNIPEEKSYEYYNQLEQLFEDKSLTYHHQWEPGDALLMDNVRTMHGRAAYTGLRKLVQFQVRS